MLNFNISRYFEQKVAAKEAAFLQFVRLDRRLSEIDRQTIAFTVQKGEIQKVLHVFFVLVVWSSVAALIDFVLFSSSVFMSFVNGKPHFLYLILFLLVNAVLKLWYVHRQIPTLSLVSLLLTLVPYFGGGHLLTCTIKKCQKTKQALFWFLKS